MPSPFPFPTLASPSPLPTLGMCSPGLSVPLRCWLYCACLLACRWWFFTGSTCCRRMTFTLRVLPCLLLPLPLPHYPTYTPMYTVVVANVIPQFTMPTPTLLLYLPGTPHLPSLVPCLPHAGSLHYSAYPHPHFPPLFTKYNLDSVLRSLLVLAFTFIPLLYGHTIHAYVPSQVLPVDWLGFFSLLFLPFGIPLYSLLVSLLPFPTPAWPSTFLTYHLHMPLPHTLFMHTPSHNTTPHFGSPLTRYVYLPTCLTYHPWDTHLRVCHATTLHPFALQCLLPLVLLLTLHALPRYHFTILPCVVVYTQPCLAFVWDCRLTFTDLFLYSRGQPLYPGLLPSHPPVTFTPYRWHYLRWVLAA